MYHAAAQLLAQCLSVGGGSHFEKCRASGTQMHVPEQGGWTGELNPGGEVTPGLTYSDSSPNPGLNPNPNPDRLGPNYQYVILKHKHCFDNI